MRKKLCKYQFFTLLLGVLFWMMPLAVRAEEPADGGDKSNGFIFNEGGYDPANPDAYPLRLPSEETVYTAGGGQIIWTPETDSAGNVVSGRLTLRDAVIQNTYSGATFENYGSGIWMCVPFELVLEGENRITSQGRGIFLTDSNNSGTRTLNVRGTGSLTIDSQMEGIRTDGAVTLDAVNLTVTYGFASGIITEYGDIVIQNGSRVTLKNSAGITVSSAAVRTNNIGDVSIRNSHVIAVNSAGTAISANGNVLFESSQVRALGSAGPGGVITFGNDKSFTVNGGSLYVKNNQAGGLDIYPDPDHVKWENSAVIYCGGPYNYLIQKGDNIQYADCVYDEASDQITSVGNGNVYGNVVWNEHIRFPLGADQRLYIGMLGSTLTIPEGTTAVIPDGATLRNSYGGTGEIGVLTNYGTLNVSEGGTLYNFDGANGGREVLTRNYGEINLAPGATFFNTSLLENKGTINADGTLCSIQVNFNGDPYNGVIQNEGTINGLVNIRESGQVRYQAEGNAVLRNGQTLELGAGTANNGAWGTVLEIPAGGKLTIEEGAVVDAKTHVTNENLSIYLKLGDTLVVDGILLLPEDLSEEERNRLAETIGGTGTVQTGNTVNFIITFDLGDGTVEKRLLPEGSTFTLPPDPVRSGYLFEGWYINTDGKETAADQTMTAAGHMTIYARWKPSDTGETPGGEDKPGEDQKPGETDKPGGEEKPGEDNKPDGTDTPGGDNKPGGTNKPGGDNKPGGTDTPGGSNTAGTSSDPKGDHANGASNGAAGSSTSDSGNGRNKGDLYVNGQNSAGAVRTGDTADWGAAVLGLVFSLAAIGGIKYSRHHSD